MSRCKYRTSSRELIKLIKDDVGLSCLAHGIAYKIIGKARDAIDRDQKKLDDFRNHRSLRYDDVMYVYVQAMFGEVGCALPDKYIVDYD